MNLSSSRKPVERLQRHPQPGPSKRVMLLGATGFIGSRILQALESQIDTPISILSRRHDNTVGRRDNSVTHGDITDPSALQAAMAEADVVINAASYVGPDAELAKRVNLEGTHNVLRACRDSATVSRIIQLSTTSVYGSGPHQGQQPWELQVNPESAASITRAAGEQAVLADGGTVIRPNLVHGVGDRWFIPGVIKMFGNLKARIDNSTAKVSLIDVADLGALVAALARASTPVSGAFHAANPKPIVVGELLDHLSREIQQLELSRGRSLSDALPVLEEAGFRPHQVRLLAQDHYYDSIQLWEIAGLSPKPFQLSPEAAAWYRHHLTRG
ncbi:epimerase [Paenarthrobacter ureafaciens]|uniref:NAD-dependent epimerase/dehydratase family protein n=2 Tax=Paenarthrobacter ureafaciens TaxID=37931 RepID=UPI003CEEC4DB|nr:epimerase [Paenarthrobacter ureafaciens]